MPLLVILQSAVAIFIFFIANMLTNATFLPDVLAPLYRALPTMLVRLFVLALPIYAVGILMLASAFAQNATLTGPTILFANILATIATTMAIDGIPFRWMIAVAGTLCLAADVFLYLVLKGRI